MISNKEYFLVNIRPNKVRVGNLKTGEFLESDDSLTFGNERLLVSDVKEPEETIKYFVEKLSPPSLITLSRTIILNPYHPSIDAFSEVEKMIFRDLAVRAGGRIVYFKFGEEISSRHIDLKNIQAGTEV